MNRKQFVNRGLCLLALVTVSSHLAVLADDIDEKQKALESRINEAAQSKQLSEKDASIIRREMSAFNKKKTSLRAASSDKLTLSDNDELDKSLNKVSQDFEKKKKSSAK